MNVLFALLEGQGQLIGQLVFLLAQLLHYSGQLEPEPLRVWIFPIIILMQLFGRARAPLTESAKA